MPIPATDLLRQKEIHGFYTASFARIFLLIAIGAVIYLSELPQINIYEFCGFIGVSDCKRTRDEWGRGMDDSVLFVS